MDLEALKKQNLIEINGRVQFDKRVEIRDPKTGQILAYKPYRMHVSRDEGEIFERPQGYFWRENGELVKQPVTQVEVKPKKELSHKGTIEA